MNEPLAKQVYGKLHSRLISGELPPGSRLDYKALAHEMGVSTTPIREAATKLASEGFVELVPRLGAVVRSLCRNTAQELFEVREALESFAAAKAAERMSPRHLQTLKKHHETMLDIVAKHHGCTQLPIDQSQHFIANDQTFHQTIIAGARNTALKRALDESQGQLRLFSSCCRANDLSRLTQFCEQHQQIVDALESHNPAMAVIAVTKHIRRAFQNTLDHLDIVQSDGFSQHSATSQP